MEVVVEEGELAIRGVLGVLEDREDLVGLGVPLDHQDLVDREDPLDRLDLVGLELVVVEVGVVAMVVGVVEVVGEVVNSMRWYISWRYNGVGILVGRKLVEPHVLHMHSWQ